jgi:hypothetical protein
MHRGEETMPKVKILQIALLGCALSLPLLVRAQNADQQSPPRAMTGPTSYWPGGGPGPYSPYAAGRYRVGNPYAEELNALAVKNPKKHDACYRDANQKNLRRDARWKFMLECMKKS